MSSCPPTERSNKSALGIKDESTVYGPYTASLPIFGLRPIAADVARSLVCLSACLSSMCWMSRFSSKLVWAQKNYFLGPGVHIGATGEHD